MKSSPLSQYNRDDFTDYKQKTYVYVLAALTPPCEQNYIAVKMLEKTLSLLDFLHKQFFPRFTTEHPLAVAQKCLQLHKDLVSSLTQLIYKSMDKSNHSGISPNSSSIPGSQIIILI